MMRVPSVQFRFFKSDGIENLPDGGLGGQFMHSGVSKLSFAHTGVCKKERSRKKRKSYANHLPHRLLQ